MSTMLTATPGQTIGPFYGFALPAAHAHELVPPGHPGAIQFHGRVTDGDGAPIPDALLEISQADPNGILPSSAPGSLDRDGWTFTGWGRTATDPGGHYSFTTVAPGATQPDSVPFIGVTVFARGLLNRLFTRAYLPGCQLGSDKLLAALPAARRETLIAVADEHGLRFDIRLQGGREAEETVFLRYPGH